MKSKTLSILLLPIFLLAACNGESTSDSIPTSVPSISDTSTSVNKEEILKEKVAEITAKSDDNYTLSGAMVDYLQTENYMVTSFSIHIKLAEETYDYSYVGGQLKLVKDSNWYAFVLDSFDAPTNLNVEAGAMTSEPTKILLSSLFDLTKYTYNTNTDEFDYVIDYESIEGSLFEYLKEFIDIEKFLYKISVGIDDSAEIYLKLWSQTSSFDTLRFSNVGESKLDIVANYSQNGDVPVNEMKLAPTLISSFSANNYSTSANITESTYSSREAYLSLEEPMSENTYSTEVKSDNTYYYVIAGGTKDLYENADPQGYGNYHNDGTSWSELTTISSEGTWQDAFNTMDNIASFTDENLATFLNPDYQREYLKQYSIKSTRETDQYLNEFLSLIKEASRYSGNISVENLGSLSLEYTNYVISNTIETRIILNYENADSTYTNVVIDTSFSTFNATVIDKDSILAAI